MGTPCDLVAGVVLGARQRPAEDARGDDEARVLLDVDDVRDELGDRHELPVVGRLAGVAAAGRPACVPVLWAPPQEWASSAQRRLKSWPGIDGAEHRAVGRRGAVVLVGQDDEGQVGVLADEAGVLGRQQGGAQRAEGVLEAAAARCRRWTCR